MISDILDNVRHYLPAQGPIKDFIHHNTLHAFQEYPFEKALTLASDCYGTHSYMPLSYYRRAYDEGRIDKDELLLAAQKVRSEGEIEDKARFVRIRHGCETQLGVDWDAQLNPIVFRVVSGFLDQGISLWHFVGRDLPFFEAVAKLVRQSKFPIAPYIRKSSCAAWLSLPAEEVVSSLLSKIVGDEALYEAYVRETLMAHAGWSGMVNVIEMRPGCLLRPRQITLLEFLAFKLILEWEFIEHNSKNFVPLVLSPLEKGGRGILEIQASKEYPLAVWHEAFEMTCYHKILTGIKRHNENKGEPPKSIPSAQAVFCIDDRECSFRRHLEEVDPTIETLGWAGFFGIDFCFQSLNDAVPVQMCPPIVTPKFIVKEVPAKGQEEEFLKQKAASHNTALSLELWREASSSLVLGFFAANTLGQLSIFHMFKSLFRPHQLIKSLKAKSIDIPTEISVLRVDGDSRVGAFSVGFTHDEMSTRVENVLRGMGLTKGFAKTVFVLAHGSSSVNNPHFAAYDCGACSGKPGSPNARVFAHMANLKEVRESLAQKGLCIPDDTVFVGGFHDTSTDAIMLFDVERLSDEQVERVNAFLKTAVEVRSRNARERCRRFAVVDTNISEQEAIHEVTKRALALFEPRPELGHATNVSCIVGRRELTRGLFMDRRAFMNSYDPTEDPSGDVLTQILRAAIPVCGGINLEYYFSRVDPAVYGCGTKLSHNVVGLLGVCNGTDDDLRTGLPVQMTEVHDPVRLLMVIEQTPEIIMQVLAKNAELLEWVRNQWIRVASIDPNTRAFSFYSPDKGFVNIDERLTGSVATRSSSLACYEGQRENVEIARIAAL